MLRRVLLFGLFILMNIAALPAQAEPLRLDFSRRPVAEVVQGPQPTKVAVPRCTAAPTIDGSADDTAWASAAPLQFPASGSSYLATRVRLCFDDSSLYMLAECDEKAGRKSRAEVRPRDNGTWTDDCIEVWLDTSGHGTSVCHFIVNAAGSVYDDNSADGPAFNPDWQHQVRRQDDRWALEIALPKAALGLTAWQPMLGFNVGRNGPGLGDRAWAGSFGDVSRGALVLEGVTEAPDTGQQATTVAAGPALKLHIERAEARPGERRLQAGVKLSTGSVPREQTTVKAMLFVDRQTKPVATAQVVPEQNEGSVSVDLRSLGLTKARLVVELLGSAGRLAAAETNLTARGPDKPLHPGHRIPVSLDLPEGVQTVAAWPVTFGVPFPAGAMWDAKCLRLVDGKGREVPCQKEVTALWAPEGAIKWVRFDALVSSGETYQVEVTIGPVAPAATPLKLTEQGEKLVLETGAARYVLGRGASPVEEIWVGGKRVATATGTRGLYLLDQHDRLASASAEGETMEIEASGPVAACVRFEGEYRTAEGEALARHITRVEAFAGQPFARITHTLVLTNDTNKVWFKDIGWEFAVEPGADPAALFGTSRAEWRKFEQQPLSDTIPAAYVFQDDHFFFAHGTNHFVAAKQDAAGKAEMVAEGEEMGDWAALAGKGGGLAVSCREAARQHPKEFEVRRDRVVLRLFSNRGGEELDFRAATLIEKWDLATWYDNAIPVNSKQSIEDVLKRVAGYESDATGWSKTHELLLCPLQASVTPEQVAQQSRLHSRPVFALADPAWICQSGAMGAIHPKDTARFPEAETAIDAAVRYWDGKVDEWGDYGFVDYYMGPHLGYRGKYAAQYRYSQYTYTLRPDLWLLYARSGERFIREFAQGTNRAQMDACMGHWDGPRKTRGLYLSASGTDIPAGGANMGMLPFYWESYSSLHISSASNLNDFIWDYYLTGYRRAKDGVLDYVDGVKHTWTPALARRDGRALVLLRMLTQAYAFTWDPQLRDMAEATMDAVYKPDAELGLFQKRTYYETEERNTAYKTQVDVRAVIEAWQVLGGRRYHDIAMKLSRYWWQKFLGEWPLFYCNPHALVGSFLYRETGDPRYVQGSAFQVRQAASAYDPETDRTYGAESGEKTTFLFEGIPHAQAVLMDAGLDKTPHTSWMSYEDFGSPSSIVVGKSGNQAVCLDVEPCQDLRLAPADGKADGATVASWIKQESYNNQSIEIPAKAPAGAYQVIPTSFGQHTALADARVPLVLYAPEYWRPAPPQVPAIRYYFKLPPDSTDAQIILEGSARLFDPQGQPWRDGEPLHGVVDLPADKPGLWSFLPVDNQLVKVRNLPPFFAAESAASYFEPPLAWQREQLPVAAAAPAKTDYVEGAVATPGNQALYVSRPGFQMPTASPHPSGDGNQFLASKEGTIEFWFRPSWGTVDLPAKSWKTLCRLYVPSGKQSYALTYRMAPRSRDASVDFYGSHCLNAYFESASEYRRGSLQGWRRTVFSANEWVHVAWVWGWRNGVIPHTVRYHTKPQDDVLITEIYVNGRKGQNYGYRWMKDLIVEVPHLLELKDLDGAVDELRVSDIQRYTGDFTPPGRNAESKIDEHTRALFHFNGNLVGRGYGYEGEIPVELK